MATVSAEAAKKFVLCIDAGHGGHDAGAVGVMSQEKNINLKTALAFGRYVEENCPDVKVIYTRKTDVFIPLHQRADIANKNHADVFISIHTNSLPAGRIARGIETYTMGMRRSDEKLSAAKRENSVIMIEDNYQEHYEGYDPNSPESAIMFEFIHDANMSKSVDLAKLVQKNLCQAAGRANKGVKQDVFLVLRETSMPACLIELGFISTPDEERLLNDPAHIDKMAYGIYSAFAKYKDKNAVVIPYKQAPATQVDLPTIVPQEEPQEPKPAKVTDTKKNSAPADNAKKNDGVPVYKVQFMTGPRALKSGDAAFKGLTETSYYRDGSVYKFTVGEYTSFSEAAAMKKKIADKFPDAFIVAFLNGQRINLNEARNMK